MGDARTVAIVLGAGVGSRMGTDEPKAFLTVEGVPMLAAAVAAASACAAVDAVIVTAPPGAEDRARRSLGHLAKPTTVIAGGRTRHGSVRAALDALPNAVSIVAVHDAARPFAPPSLFSEVIAAIVAGADGAIPVVPIADTVKRVRGGVIVATEPRDDLALAQTPQAFRATALQDAHRRAAEVGLEFTDDSAVVEWAGYRVRTVPGDPANVKVTTPRDLVRVTHRGGGGDA